MWTPRSAALAEPSRSGSSGFTLLEVLISLLVLGIFAGVAGVVFQGALRSEELMEADRELLGSQAEFRMRLVAGQEEGWEDLLEGLEFEEPE